MNPQIVIATYKPKPGRDSELRALLAEHVPLLQRLGLVTNRPPIHAQSANGTYIEIFEWNDGSAAAHQDPEVMALWNKMALVGEFETISSIEESTRQFPHFRPISL